MCQMCRGEQDAEAEQLLPVSEMSSLGDTFISHRRSEQSFTADLLSPAAEPIQFDREISARGGIGRVKLGFCRLLWKAIKNTGTGLRVWTRPGFFAALAGLLSVIYVEEDRTSDYDKTLTKLHGFYDTVRSHYRCRMTSLSD